MHRVDGSTTFPQGIAPTGFLSGSRKRFSQGHIPFSSESINWTMFSMRVESAADSFFAQRRKPAVWVEARCSSASKGGVYWLPVWPQLARARVEDTIDICLCAWANGRHGTGHDA